MSTIESMMWTEKYRPRVLDDLAMSDGNRVVIADALEKGEVPHLLLHGPAGCGKSSLAYVIRDSLDCRALVLNASKERGLDVIRERVGTFARVRLGARWNLAILDEADYLTTEAQTALRNLMETYADVCRFVLTANYPHRILDPIRSRCVEIAMDVMGVKDRARVMLRVLDAEGVEAVPEVVRGWAESHTDLRRMLSGAQRSVVENGGVLGACGTVAEADAVRALELVAAGDYPGLRSIARDPATNHSELLRAMFWAVDDDDPKAASRRLALAEAYDQTPQVPDPVVHFLGVVAGMCSV